MEVFVDRAACHLLPNVHRQELMSEWVAQLEAKAATFQNDKVERLEENEEEEMELGADFSSFQRTGEGEEIRCEEMRSHIEEERVERIYDGDDPGEISVDQQGIINNPYHSDRVMNTDFFEKQVRVQRNQSIAFGVLSLILAVMFFVQVYFYNAVRGVKAELCLGELHTFNQLSLVAHAFMTCIYFKHAYVAYATMRVNRETLRKDRAVWKRLYGTGESGSVKGNSKGKKPKNNNANRVRTDSQTSLLEENEQAGEVEASGGSTDQGTEGDSGGEFEPVDESNSAPAANYYTHLITRVQDKVRQRRGSGQAGKKHGTSLMADHNAAVLLQERLDGLITNTIQYAPLRKTAELGGRVKAEQQLSEAISTIQVLHQTQGKARPMGIENGPRLERSLRAIRTAPSLGRAMEKSKHIKRTQRRARRLFTKYMKMCLAIQCLPFMTTLIMLVLAANIVRPQDKSPLLPTAQVCLSSFVYGWFVVIFMLILNICSMLPLVVQPLLPVGRKSTERSLLDSGAGVAF